MLLRSNERNNNNNDLKECNNNNNNKKTNKKNKSNIYPGSPLALAVFSRALSVGHESRQDSVTVFNIVRNYCEAFSTF